MRCRVVKCNSLLSEKRFDGSYHNADVNIYDGIIRAHSDHKLSYYCSSIFTSGRAKRSYTIKQFGLPFLSNTDVATQNPLTSCKYSSKKYSYDETALLKGGMILTGRVGAIGQTSFVPEFWEQYLMMGSDNIIRIVVKPEFKKGFIYAYLASKIGYLSFWKLATGGVQPFITEAMVGNLPIPNLPETIQQEVDSLILQSIKLREQSATILTTVQKELKQFAKLPDLSTEDYDFYGVSTKGRQPSMFIRNKKDITTTTINAFNHSARIRQLKSKISQPYILLHEAIENGDFFTTGSFTRKEAPKGKGVMLINQSDIFNFNIKGKHIYKRYLKNIELVDYGEVLIAGVGTLGENETFCRCIFANESLKDQLVSGEFLRMKTVEIIPSGYLYAWLSSDYGFRLIRSTQSGTKQCRPIQKLLLNIPVPLLSNEKMQSIDEKVRFAHTLQYRATSNENKAINIVEKEIEKWRSASAL